MAAANSSGLHDEKPPRDRLLAGPVRAMSLTLDKIEEETRVLEEALASGASVVDLDPALVDPSFVEDRFSQSDDAAFDALKESLRNHGQEVPVLVRPHPDAQGRFQAAYGHRRLRAARELGIKLRAVVRALDDRQLLLAQGIENSARRDLSFIERALFALTMEDRGFDRALIMAALSTDKTELSKMLSVARALPRTLAQAIGPAPRAGRRRWQQLAEALGRKSALRRVEIMLADPNAPQDTDRRFLRALELAADATTSRAPDEGWSTADGAAVVKISRSVAATTLRFDEKAEPEFAAFVLRNLADLHRRFLASRDDAKS